MRAVLLAVALASTALAGCLDTLLPSDLPPPTVTGNAWTMELPVTINVVAVGFDGRLAAEELLKDAPATRPVFNQGEAGAQMALHLEPVQYRLTWKLTEAPEAFAQALFAEAQKASFEGPAPAYLVQYDSESGQMRLPQSPIAQTPLAGTPLAALGQTEDARMTYIDVIPVQDWIQEHRGEYGLAFPEPEYTVFLLDSYTNGYLPQDSYHYWYFDDGTIDADLDRAGAFGPGGPALGYDGPDEFHTPKDPTSNRGWGGGYDFAWIDVGAAPSWLDDRPWVPPFEDDNFDHPIWELTDDSAKLHRNLGRHLADFALVKILRTPVYDFEWVEKWVFPVHVFVEEAALSNHPVPYAGVDVQRWLIPERIEKAFEDVAPWVDAEVTVAYHFLPQDDPGMWEAVETAKRYGSPTIASSGVIEDYVRNNWGKYVPAEEEDTRVIPQFFFYFGGAYTFWGPNQGGGYAAGDGWGRAWAGFDHVFDVCANQGQNLQGSCFGTKAQKWEGDGTMDMLVIHEGGHHIGFTHARDTAVLNEEGYPEYAANWFWDSVHSVMTYRHQNPRFDVYDEDTLARGHAGDTLNRTAARLAADGVPDAARATALDGIARAEGLLREGRWQDAARAGIATWKALRAVAGEGPEAPPTVAESFGDRPLFAVSPGIGGSFGPVPMPVPVPQPDTPLNYFVTEVEVKEGAEYLHMAFRDLRPQAGALRFAYLVLLTQDDELAGFTGNDIFSESFVTHFRAGPGTYRAVLVTNGGLASEYDVTLDVHYPES